MNGGPGYQQIMAARGHQRWGVSACAGFCGALTRTAVVTPTTRASRISSPRGRPQQFGIRCSEMPIAEAATGPPTFSGSFSAASMTWTRSSPSNHLRGRPIKTPSPFEHAEAAAATSFRKSAEPRTSGETKTT